MTDEQQPVTTPDLVDLHCEATDQSTVVDALLGLLEGAGRLRDADACRTDLMAREAIGSTVIPGGVAIPHARTAGVDVPTVAVLRLSEPVAWSAGAGPVDVVLGLFTPAGDSDGYLKLLAALTRSVVARLPRDLRDAGSAREAAAMVQRGVGKL
ncbi:PTS sugar transporter subunit IIA [Nocardioides sp. AX2bis]|uniref:PTS sugar transporter subunit IIA n=1 Tax=Nocardioides sp. AX2bis TaxID=2653157 RepID=UPI0012F20EFE|nr:PTS sugar transporter subunit IIA [Nocardioides sp. AX2bis]VXB61914.1 putative PTS system fructose-specific EIIA component [Nocardioides sp. AX2bis]